MSSFCNPHQNNNQFSASRTQRKLWLQRQSFLADDKNYLDYPSNMKRLTKEIDRVNREYRCLLHYQDPLLDSIKRIATRRLPVSPSSSSITFPPHSYLSPSIRIHHKSLMTRLQQQCHHS
ncbi:hypothetical protein BCR42DRAFT_400458 [Absidia repens]|uniref:Uncharacterized protein n=1 Tax=Absidia repens TaxID=90262 RepID=A0A1X2J180_9FUNG|nr:hypothetical protein BCR42DRAFT_400458 [Absidia repens]